MSDLGQAVRVADRRKPADGSPQIDSIQVLRAVAALAVFVLHLGPELHVWSGLSWPPQTVALMAGVDLFFVISGFIMVHVSENAFGRPGAGLQFFGRRVLRIVPLYWLISIPLAVYAFWRYSDMRSADLSPELVVTSLAFIPWPRPSGEVMPILRVGWSLSYEMFFYLLFALNLAFSRRVAVAAVSLLLIGCVIVARARAFYWPEEIALEFIFGMAIALVRRDIGDLPRWTCVALGAAGIFLFGAAIVLDPDGEMRVISWGLPCALILAAVTLRRFELKGPGWRLPLLIGDASYALYLIHPAMGLFRLAIQRAFGISAGPWTWWPWTYALILTAMTIMAAIVVHLFIEVPMLRMLRGKGSAMRRLMRRPAETG